MEDLTDDALSLTQQLQRFSGGDRLIAEAVLREILPELHRVAVRELGREHDGFGFSPTELINEVWLRNLGKGGWEVNSRQHFYAIASLAMRNVLIDLARTREAQRRGHAITIPLNGSIRAATKTTDWESVVQIGILMERLEKRDPAVARIIDLHYFAGFTMDEIVTITGLSARQVRHRWEKGRDCLKDGLRS